MIEEYLDCFSNTIGRFTSTAFCGNWTEDQTVRADDLYMGVPFIAKYAELSKMDQLYDDAVNKVIEYNTMLCSIKKEYYFHCYFNQTRRNGVAKRGRANGWVIVAQVMLLELE